MPKPKVAISDSAGNEVGVTNERLDVNLGYETSIDIGDVEVKGHTTIVSGAINVTDSAVQLSYVVSKHIDIMANLSNTGIVYIGSSVVSATTGIALYPGDVYSVDVENLNQLYVISTVSGDDINVAVYA